MELKDVSAEQAASRVAELDARLAAGNESGYGENRKARRAALADAKKRVNVSHAGNITNF